MENLCQTERETITHIWSLFSSVPPRNRCLILQGLFRQCCLSQLSVLSNNLKDLIRIDFICSLPREISYKILSYLDATSLCCAAQVSKSWKCMADDDVVWHKLCEQHIDKKCYKCGWGLPLLERGRRCRNSRTAIRIQHDDVPSVIYPQTRPWKDVYRERLLVERNWRKGRYNIKILKGHTDGVLCLQFDDASNLLISGSLDNTVCVWNLETGEIVRVLRGHTRCVRALQFDEAKLITGSMDGTLRIWNYITGECVRTFTHTSGIVSLHFDNNLLASSS